MKKLQITIYLNEADRMGDFPLYEEVLRRLLHAHIAGATATLAWMGYGKHGLVHRRGLLGISDDHPVVITAVDDPGRIRDVLPRLKEIVPQGIITLHEVEVV